MEGIDWKYKIHAVNRATDKVRTDDEAILFLAKDDAVPPTLAFYYEECQRIGAEQGQLDSIRLLQTRVQNWRREHFDECKTPDMSEAERPIQIDGKIPGREGIRELRYEVACASSPEELEEKVADYLEEGYEPHGSMTVLCVLGDTNPAKFYQPVVKMITYFSVETSEQP